MITSAKSYLRVASRLEPGKHIEGSIEGKNDCENEINVLLTDKTYLTESNRQFFVQKFNDATNNFSQVKTKNNL